MIKEFFKLRMLIEMLIVMSMLSGVVQYSKVRPLANDSVSGAHPPRDI